MAKEKNMALCRKNQRKSRGKGDAGRYHILGVLWHERALILSRPHGYIEKVSIDRVEILPLTPEEEETYGLF
ncbi:hypothetical protein DMH88_14600 [Escherichia coli]|nr:hypothetical protein [Escherichia coli]